MREVATAHPWSYYAAAGQVLTARPVRDGTVAYLHSGGTYPRQLTLSGASWPTWSRYGTLMVGENAYEIAEVYTSSVATLSAASNPGADFADSAYTLFRDTYPLPADCQRVDDVHASGRALWPEYTGPRNWKVRRSQHSSPGAPSCFTVAGDPNYIGALAIRLHPPPDETYTLEIGYQRLPRPMVTEEYNAGLVSTIGNQLEVSGSGTEWTSRHIGCVLRISSTARDYPTSRIGLNPAWAERVVTDVTGATALVADEGMPGSLTGVKYTLSDPADVEEGSMLNVLLRCCERHMGMLRTRKDRAQLDQSYFEALALAREADSRYGGPRASGGVVYARRRLRDYPAEPAT